MRALALAIALALAASACGEQSKIDPNSTVRVSGQALTPSGAPLVGRAVRLGSGVSDDDATLAVLTVGLACTSGLCKGKVFDTKTSSTGHYALTLKGRDTQGSFGKVRSELLTVSAAPQGNQVSGAAASARFNIQTTTVTVPTLKLVDPHLVVTDAAPAVASHWTTAAPGPYDLTFETATTAPVWQVTTAQATASIDARVLEGSSGRVVVAGGSSDRIEGSDVGLHWRSPGIGYAVSTGTPVSRGAACTFVGAPKPTGTCGLTDGDLFATVTSPAVCPTPTSATAPPCTPPDAATIDLGAPAAADLLVIRGCEGVCSVLTSADGTTFHRVGAVSSEYATVALPGEPLRAVRVGLGELGLREVSVWTTTTAPAVLKPIESLKNLQAPYSTTTTHAHRRNLLLVVAGVLVLLILMTLAFIAGTRRRSP